MPIFEYRCQNCQNVFEVISLPGREAGPVCSACGSTSVKKLISAPFLPSSVGRPANDDGGCCRAGGREAECSPGEECGYKGPCSAGACGSGLDI